MRKRSGTGVPGRVAPRRSVLCAVLDATELFRARSTRAPGSTGTAHTIKTTERTRHVIENKGLNIRKSAEAVMPQKTRDLTIATHHLAENKLVSRVWIRPARWPSPLFRISEQPENSDAISCPGVHLTMSNHGCNELIAGAKMVSP
jgi:hypothetical protein